MTGPASLAQNEIWALDQIAEGRSAAALLWGVTIETRRSGEALAADLGDALTRLMARHACLRMRFDAAPGGLRYRLVPVAPIHLPLCDDGDLSKAGLQSRAWRFGMQGYDLAHRPPWRFRLERIAPDRYRLLCGFHHIATDGLSWGWFFRQLAQGLAGEALTATEQTYADFAEQQRSARQRPDPLAPQPWRLPGDGPQPFQPGAPAGILETTLAPTVHEDLHRQAGALGISPYRLAFAGFGDWCARAAGRDRISVDTTLAGRGKAEHEGVIGPFAGTNPIPLNRAGCRFQDLAVQVSQAFDRAIADQANPVSGTAHSRSPASFTRMPASSPVALADMTLRAERIFLPVATRALSVYITVQPKRTQLTWAHDAARFDAPAMGRAAEQFEHLLAQGLRAPERRLTQIPSIPDAQRAEVLRHARGPEKNVPAHRPLHRLVQDQAQRSPNDLAVVDGAVRLSHAQVQAKANALAIQLAALGVTPGQFVPLVMPSSAELVLAELAVLKLGAVFVPLSPEWPERRLQEVLTRLNAPVLVQRACDGQAIATSPAAILMVPPAEDIAGLGWTDQVDIAPDAPVYCIFTSGSTGQPKGVINTNRGVVNRVAAMTDMVTQTTPVVLSGASPGVDTLVWQYFWPLISGGRCVIARAQDQSSPAGLLDICVQARPTLLDFVPSVFADLVDHLDVHPKDAASLSTVRSILIGGEAMQSGHVRRFKQHLPAIDLFNSYGPTETAISTVFHKLPARIGTHVPIGRPLHNTLAVILDGQGDPAPIGWSGEFCLGGISLGAGYVGAPDLTRQSFVAVDPARVGTNRLYKTGDLARLRPDGLIEYLGRVDDQISLNGNRIEPAEIEAALMQHPQVAEAAVTLTARPGVPGQLVAFVRPAQGASPAAADLRAFLLDRLPRGWLPSAYFELVRMPRKTSGKLDRAALQGGTARPLHLRAKDTHPATALECSIIAAWSQVLGLTDIRAGDNFFLDLGGDSLAAIKLHGLLQQQLGQQIDLRDLFNHATPRALARRLSGQEQAFAEAGLADRLRPLLTTWHGARQTADSLLFTLNGTGRDARLFWCFQGFAELRELARELGPEHPVTGMRSGHLLFDYTPGNVRALARLYAAEIQALAPMGGLTIGGNCQATSIARAMADILRDAGRDIRLTILMEDSDYTRHSGRVALLYGKDSHLSPYAGGADPQALLRALYTDGHDTHFIPGSHGSFFSLGNVTGLAEILRGLLTDGGG